jgi:hypothetical protein
MSDDYETLLRVASAGLRVFNAWIVLDAGDGKRRIAVVLYCIVFCLSPTLCCSAHQLELRYCPKKRDMSTAPPLLVPLCDFLHSWFIRGLPCTQGEEKNPDAPVIYCRRMGRGFAHIQVPIEL